VPISSELSNVLHSGYCEWVGVDQSQISSTIDIGIMHR
jgi:hypothetical protein